MLPTLSPGQIVVSLPFSYVEGDVVLAIARDREVIKRVANIDHLTGKVSVLGDNIQFSTDSRQYGALDPQHIIGKVVWPIGISRSRT